MQIYRIFEKSQNIDAADVRLARGYERIVETLKWIGFGIISALGKVVVTFYGGNDSARLAKIFENQIVCRRLKISGTGINGHIWSGCTLYHFIVLA